MSEKTIDMKKYLLPATRVLLASMAGIVGIVSIPQISPPAVQDTLKGNAQKTNVSDRQKQLNKLATGSMAAFQIRQSPTPLPELAFKDEAGNALTLANFKGKVVLLNLWATWCAPCLHEMPTLDRLQRDLGSEHFEVLALSIDIRGMPAAKKMLDKLNITSLKRYNDETSKAAGRIGVQGMPTTILVDEMGQELGRLSGPAIWDSMQAKRLISAAVSSLK